MSHIRCKLEVTPFRVPHTELVVYTVVVVGVCTQCQSAVRGTVYTGWSITGYNHDHQEHDVWSWNETFNTLGELRAFIEGNKVGALVCDVRLDQCQVPDDPDATDTQLLNLIRLAVVEDADPDDAGGWPPSSDEGPQATIVTRRVEVDTDPRTNVYEAVLYANNDTHRMTFPNELFVRAYLRGIRAITFSYGKELLDTDCVLR